MFALSNHLRNHRRNQAKDISVIGNISGIQDMMFPVMSLKEFEDIVATVFSTDHLEMEEDGDSFDPSNFLELSLVEYPTKHPEQRKKASNNGKHQNIKSNNSGNLSDLLSYYL